MEEAERQEILERLQESVRGVYAKFVEDEEGRKSSIENKTKEFKETINQLAQSLLISDETVRSFAACSCRSRPRIQSSAKHAFYCIFRIAAREGI